ncbi:MAG: beta-propeller domain-containing protein [Halodesulfurarchaeum sp.]
MTRSTRFLFGLIAALALVGVLAIVIASPPGGTPAPPPADDPIEPVGAYETFDSPAAFSEYVARANRHFGGRPRVVLTNVAMSADAALETSARYQSTGLNAPRHSSTNVQEVGIGEPDLVKTDGKVAYYSPRQRYFLHGDTRPRGVHILDVSPPGHLGTLTTINDSGRLLRAGDTLVVLGGDAVVGYDVSDPSNPVQTWKRTLDGRVAAARLADGAIYLVVATDIDGSVCPVTPLEGVSTACTDIYHPPELVPTTATYNVIRLNATTGEPSGSISFVGSADSVVYMSNQSLYVTTTASTPRGELLTEFLLTSARPLLPEHTVDRLEQIQGYNLTDRARYLEASHALESWLETLPEDERKQMRQRLAERYRTFTTDRLRRLTTTNVVKVNTTTLTVEATGTVPGEPVNQFALDERNGYLRIATTVRAPDLRWEGANMTTDAYVLDENLSITGRVLDMSEGQEVYSVRFVGETGYVITFRQVDPLHVLDLSNPSNPTERGALKLPGFSRYLHPLSGDRLLGIGEENGQVKAVIFDVSDPTDPAIEHSRVLAADWSAISESHHAFLRDPRHDAFFLPTESGGKILSTKNLTELRTVHLRQPRRAIFVGDYLYVFGQEEVAAVNERTWTVTARLDLPTLPRTEEKPTGSR